MLTLVYKDIICQKRSLWLVFVYPAFMHLAFYSLPDLGAYVAGAVVVTYVFVLGACALEEKNRSDALINSLPISRETVVKAKYLTSLFFLVIGIGVSTLVGAMMHYLGLARGLVDLETAVGMVIASAFLWSMYYPVYFKFGYLKARYYNTVVFLLTIFGSGFLFEWLISKMEKAESPDWLVGLPQLIGQHDTVIAACLLAACFLWCLVSLAFSIKFYQGREFG